MISDKEFSQLVESGIDAIPERFLKRLDNVAIVIAEKPSLEQLRSGHVPHGDTLLGLYEGIPLTERGEYYGTGSVIPDKITIFKLPIVQESEGDIERMKRIVRDTVWHEIAHYFGYDDDTIEYRELHGLNHSE